MSARTFNAAFVAAAIALVLAGCGGDPAGNTTEAQSPSTIVAASQRAAQHSSSVLASGLVQGLDGAIRVDLHIASGVGAYGYIKDHRYNVEIVRIDQTIYVKSDLANFYEHVAHRRTSPRLLERWIRASVNSGGLIRVFSKFTELPNLTRDFYSQPGRLSMDGTGGVVGTATVEVKNDATDEVLYVGATGPRYPAQILKTGATSSEGIAFDEWDLPVHLSPPPNSIGIEQLRAKA